MKRVVFLMALVLTSVGVFAQSPEAVVGKWLNKDKDAHIQIYKRGDTYAGKIVWLKNPNDESGKPKKDARNPSENLKNRSINGLEILKGFKYDGGGVWEDGTIYDPKSGKTYSCKLTLESNNKLSVRGFIGVSLLGRTDTWTRVE